MLTCSSLACRPGQLCRLAGSSKVAQRQAPPRLLAQPSQQRRALQVVAAQDDNRDEGEAFRTSSTLPAFTRRREHIIGRVAAIGFAFSLVGELLAGVGPVAQLHYETGISYKWLYVAMLALAAWGLVGAALPGSPTYDMRNLRDAQKRVTVNPFKQPRKFLVQNEVLIGRLAMAGFVGACLLEYLWGGEAPLVHLGLIQPGTQLADAPWWAIGLVSLFLADGVGAFSALRDPARDDDVY